MSNNLLSRLRDAVSAAETLSERASDVLPKIENVDLDGLSDIVSRAEQSLNAAHEVAETVQKEVEDLRVELDSIVDLLQASEDDARLKTGDLVLSSTHETCILQEPCSDGCGGWYVKTVHISSNGLTPATDGPPNFAYAENLKFVARVDWNLLLTVIAAGMQN